MTRLLHTYNDAATRMEQLLTPLLPVLARLVFAGVLVGYFWTSAITKLGPGPLGFLFPSPNGFVQIFPRAMEAAGYDASQLGLVGHLIVVAGLIAEFVLPLLIVIGALTRLAALGMIGFVLVQSLTDIAGHGADAGMWFDRVSDSLIADQRAFWLLLLAILVARGAGRLSVDRVLLRA